MPVELAFHQEDLREWQELSAGIQEPLTLTLAAWLIEPRMPASQRHGSTNRRTIKLRAAGIRLSRMD